MTSKPGQASFSSSSPALLSIPYSITPGESRNFDLTTSSQNTSSITINDPAYLTSQVRSAEWIGRYGLKSQKLTFDQILQQIGFKRVESFDPVIGKTVTAKYAGNLYHEIQHDNGDRYVLTCRPEKLREYHFRLTGMLNLLRKRLHFISSGSRRLFGVIAEPSVCLICDCKSIDHRIFNQYQVAVASLLKEQITKIKRFNLIWVSNDNEQFRDGPIDVTSSNIDQAIDWIYDRKCPRSSMSVSATCEAIVKSLKNDVHAIYLISEGDSSDSAREMLRDTIVKNHSSSTTPIPVHVVSLFCHNNDTQAFLRSLAEAGNGSYFCYKIRSELPDLKAPPNLNDPTRIQLQGDKLQFGTNALTPAPEYPVDITLMYKEIIQCQSIIDRLEKILGFIRDENQSSSQSLETKSLDAFNVSGEHHFQRSVIIQSSTLFNQEENEMSSADWLKLYGIDAQKLDFFSVLHAAAFRHCDGVVTVLRAPDDDEEVTESTPANPQDKLINAKYCDQFAHVAWPDGTIRHVHVTPELYRDYERRIRAVLEKIKARLSWLKKGSRDVFGIILENNIYILIDTSKSMQHHLPFVKEKLRLLIQDQLGPKERVNFVAFNSTVIPWRDRLVKINESTVHSQLQPWIDGLHAEGTTNTLGALRFALADPATEAIYLLTDGRPDQSERHILSQVQYRQTLPIHTIAFNCQDQTANQFLYDLAKQTGGRFHAFNYGFDKPQSVEIPESEDVGYLKKEYARGEEELAKIGKLRDECLGLAWSKENFNLRTSKYTGRQRSLNSLLTESKDPRVVETNNRPSSSTVAHRAQKKKNSGTRGKRRRRSASANSKDRKDILKVDPNMWLLPETKEYLKLEKKESAEEQKQEAMPRIVSPVQTSYDEVKAYLKKNSLVRKGLTIFDILQPTSITVREPRYIQVIDRHILAKVWEDILPMVYGSYVGKLRLVNHYAVDLEKYEIELKKLLIEYHHFTARFIWKHLTDQDKEKLGPHLYWINLSKEEQSRFTREINKDEYRNQDDLERSAWRKLTEDEQQDFLKTPPVYQDDLKSLLKKTLKDADDESTLRGVSRMDVEIQRATKFLQISTDLRQLQKRPEPEPKVESKAKLPARRKPSVDRNFGQRVICRFDEDGFFRPGTVQKGVDGQAVVHFDMNVDQEVAGHVLLPIGGAIAQPTLYLNDPVLVRQSSGHDEYWAPGLVAVLPLPGAPPPPLYTIQIYTPSENLTHVHRKDLLKISLGLFQRTVLYLQNIRHRFRPSNDPTQGEPSSDRIKSALGRELQPLNEKVDDLFKSHNRRYDELRKALNDQTAAIQNLQEKFAKPSPPPARPQKGEDHSKSTPVQPQDVPELRPGEGPGTGGSGGGRPPTPKPTRPLSESPKPAPPQPNPATRPTDPDDPEQPKPTAPSTSKPADYIPINTRVIAVWSDDDGLAHESTVIGWSEEKNTYDVERVEIPSYRWEIPREDIFLITDRIRLETASIKSFALMKYPIDLRERWSPCVILAHDRSKARTTVRYYDCATETLSADQSLIIPITEAQFTKYVTKRIEIETSLIGKPIVGLNREKDLFMSGRPLERIGTGQEYRIRWFDGTISDSVADVDLFPAPTACIRFSVGQCVLVRDNEERIYHLGRIVSISNDEPILTVRLHRPDEDDKDVHVPAIQALPISEAYYRSIIDS